MEALAWRTRPFARTFDLLASEYGWTDETVLDLTLGRLRQCREIVFERQAEERRRDLSVREVELRILAQFMAQSPEAAKDAQRIELLDRPKDLTAEPATGSYEKALGMFSRG